MNQALCQVLACLSQRSLPAAGAELLLLPAGFALSSSVHHAVWIEAAGRHLVAALIRDATMQLRVEIAAAPVLADVFDSVRIVAAADALVVVVDTDAALVVQQMLAEAFQGLCCPAVDSGIPEHVAAVMHHFPSFEQYAPALEQAAAAAAPSAA